MDLGLKGKRVLVLGASSGIGYGIAKAYHAEGARLAIASRNKERIERAAATLPGTLGLVCDLQKVGSGKRVVEELIRSFGGIDILVTNSGGPPKGNFAEIDVQEWQSAFQLLWLSSIEAINASLPSMRNQRWGRILLDTSIAAKEPIAGLTISNALRAGLLGLMKTLSRELAPSQITVNALLPGYTATERLAELGIPLEELAKDIPMGRLADPAEIGALAAFLGSPLAGYITGQAIACDGGALRGGC